MTKDLVDTSTGEALTDVEVVLAWQNKVVLKRRKVFGMSVGRGKKGGVDFDATALCLNARGQITRACSVENPTPFGATGAMIHTGDDDGTGGADSSESITINLATLAPAVEGIGLILASFGGQGFDQVNGTDFFLNANGVPHTHVMLPISERGKNAAIMGVLWRKQDGSGWEITEIGQLLEVNPIWDGNSDGVVNWQDMTGQVAQHFTRARR